MSASSDHRGDHEAARWREDRFHVGQVVRTVAGFVPEVSFNMQIREIYVLDTNAFADIGIPRGTLIADCFPDGSPAEYTYGFPLSGLEPVAE